MGICRGKIQDVSESGTGLTPEPPVSMLSALPTSAGDSSCEESSSPSAASRWRFRARTAAASIIKQSDGFGRTVIWFLLAARSQPPYRANKSSMKKLSEIAPSPTSSAESIISSSRPSTVGKRDESHSIFIVMADVFLSSMTSRPRFLPAIGGLDYRNAVYLIRCEAREFAQLNHRVAVDRTSMLFVSPPSFVSDTNKVSSILKL